MLKPANIIIGSDFLSLIQCAEYCKYQLDGYCNLEICGSVNSPQHICPYFLPRLANMRKGLTESRNPDKLDSVWTVGDLL